MQSLSRQIQRLALSGGTIVSKQITSSFPKILPVIFQKNIHTSLCLNGEPKNFLRHNDKIYPIQKPDEPRRPAFVCHQKCNVRYSPKKLWYVACLVRGMTVDEAIKQLSFVLRKGGAIVKETILEAQRKAVEEHNVEFKSNLWVSESFCTKGFVVRGMRRHAKQRIGEIRYTYSHYFVTLEEGKPPEHYYLPYPKTPEQMLDSWKTTMRRRKVNQSL